MSEAHDPFPAPESVTTPFDDLVDAPLNANELPFLSDEEASSVASITPRTLRTLQSVGLITATKAPLKGGGYRRVWQLPEVALAAAAHFLKSATNVDYEVAGELLSHCSGDLKDIFVTVWRHRDKPRDLYVAANLSMFPSAGLFLVRQTSPTEQTQVIPVARLDKGEVQRIERDTPDSRAATSRAFNLSIVQMDVRLGVLFSQVCLNTSAVRPSVDWETNT